MLEHLKSIAHGPPWWSNVKNPPTRAVSSLVAQRVKSLPAMRETQVRSLGREDPLEKEMATHSSILAWNIPMDREAWRATAHGALKSQTRLSDFTFRSRLHCLYRCRGHEFELWSGRFHRPAEQLAPCITTTEHAHLDLVLHCKRVAPACCN